MVWTKEQKRLKRAEVKAREELGLLTNEVAAAGMDLAPLDLDLGGKPAGDTKLGDYSAACGQENVGLGMSSVRVLSLVPVGNTSIPEGQARPLTRGAFSR